jgi:hypothetical protein
VIQGKCARAIETRHSEVTGEGARNAGSISTESMSVMIGRVYPHDHILCLFAEENVVGLFL